ncbi:protein of unknown function [Kushneria avicenniae]|uniref:DUF4124 domain-containing protein n=2 Tax=Kushneria avicenniae TaxID=402385 RepID=A0A1I1MPI3_9GAMM|nr:protein of unknown function [Kushneria avicenniae]
MMLWVPVVCALLVDAIPQAGAAVYRHLDAQGNVVWSDRPGGIRAEVRPPRVLSSGRVPVMNQGAAAAPAPFTPYQSVRLRPRSAPVTLEQARRGVSLRVETAPQLRNGDRVQLSVDGKRHQSPLSSRVLMAIGLDAGAHALVAEVLDASGTVRQRSPVMTLEVVSSPESGPVLAAQP